jgi:hypothetical protein
MDFDKTWNGKLFQATPEDRNLVTHQTGHRIFYHLKQNYEKMGCEGGCLCDMMLNSLVSSLVILIRENCDEDNRPYLIQLVNKILNHNLIKPELK